MTDRMRVRDYFDGVYSTHDRFWWNKPGRYELDPNAYFYSLLTQQTLRLLKGRPPGRALDLGSGEGSDAIRLALLGYDVHAVEASAIGARKIKNFAKEAHVKLRITNADIQDFTPDGQYDIVICNGVLHYIKNKESVISLMRKVTAPGGLNVISLWSTFTPVPDCHEIVPVYCDDEQGVVTGSYENWVTELLYYERNKAETAHSDLPSHSHSHIKLITSKPGC